ncbi:hypothetical protein GGH92_006324, partial [Coemansia sp. RSA 2673]
MSAKPFPEYEYEDEEYYIVAVLPSDALKNAYMEAADHPNSDEDQPKYALIDIGSNQPMLELEGAIYRGTTDELLGTSLLFDSGPDDTDPEQTTAEFIAKTSRVISFYPVS